METSSAGVDGWIEAPAGHVGDAIVAALAAGGIDHVFFTSGAEIGFFQEAIAKARAHGRKVPRLVTVPHEHVALNAALGFAAVSGRPALSAVHVDCGTQHWGGAVHTAWRSGLPVLMAAGFPPTAYAGSMNGARDEGGHLWMQESYDQHGIVRGYTKWDRRLAYQDNPGLIVSRAIQVACSEPCGPVYLSFPKELALTALRDKRFPSAGQLGIPRPAAPDPEALKELAERLVKARLPVAVVSGSGRTPSTVPALVELCELLGIAVVEAAQKSYLSFPSRHPLYQAQTVLKEADAVLVLEADVPWVPGRNSPPAGAYIAALGRDPIKLRIPTYEFTANLRLACDPQLGIKALTAAAAELLSAADKDRIAERAAKFAQAARSRIENLKRDALAQSKNKPIGALWTTYCVAEALDDNCIVIDDTLPGNRTRDYVPCHRPGSYFANPGSSGGWAPGAALGAKLAAPGRDIVALTGDGFYMFGTPAPALWAGAHHGAPFLIVVHTNRSYTTGTTRVLHSFGADSYAAKAGFEGGYFDPPIDFAKEAEAAGAYGETVRDPQQLPTALKRGLAEVRGGKPAVISVWEKRLEAED